MKDLDILGTNLAFFYNLQRKKTSVWPCGRCSFQGQGQRKRQGNLPKELQLFVSSEGVNATSFSLLFNYREKSTFVCVCKQQFLLIELDLYRWAALISHLQSRPQKHFSIWTSPPHHVLYSLATSLCGLCSPTGVRDFCSFHQRGCRTVWDKGLACDILGFLEGVL